MIVDDSLFILYVADQDRSRAFYRATFDAEPSLDEPGMTEFRLGPHVRLGLMPEAAIARLITPALPHPSAGQGGPRCEVYLRVDDPGGAAQRALNAGATPVRPLAPMGWGDVAVYVADLDGHVLAFARRIGSG